MEVLCCSSARGVCSVKFCSRLLAWDMSISYARSGDDADDEREIAGLSPCQAHDAIVDTDFFFFLLLMKYNYINVELSLLLYRRDARVRSSTRRLQAQSSLHGLRRRQHDGQFAHQHARPPERHGFLRRLHQRRECFLFLFFKIYISVTRKSTSSCRDPLLYTTFVIETYPVGKRKKESDIQEDN